MDEQERLDQQIQAYLDGTLNASERSVFEQQLKSDPALQQAVHRHRLADAAIRYARGLELKSRLRAIDAEGVGRGRSVTRRVVYLRRLAAAVVFLVIAVGLHFYAHQTYEPPQIAERLFAPGEHEVYRGEPGAFENATVSFNAAEDFFRNGEFAQARDIYLEILKEDSLLRDRAEWNLALCYFAIDPSDPQFNNLFDQILSNPQHAYHAQAKKLRAIKDSMLYRMINR